jgi:hypothetical protein
MMKKFALLLALFALAAVLGGCTEEVVEYKDATLVFEQYPDLENGLVYVCGTMKWEKNALESIHFEQEYDNEDDAEAAFKRYAVQFDASTNLRMDSVNISYNVALGDWEEKTYQEAYEMMGKSSEWKINEELSFEADCEHTDTENSENSNSTGQ